MDFSRCVEADSSAFAPLTIHNFFHAYRLPAIRKPTHLLSPVPARKFGHADAPSPAYPWDTDPQRRVEWVKKTSGIFFLIPLEFSNRGDISYGYQ